MRARDIIVVGASAGGVEALTTLLGGIPKELPASIFVVMHLPSEGPSHLPEILARHSAIPVLMPESGESFVRGRVYVCKPDRHFLVGKTGVFHSRGPSENGARPAIDTLFRSAAANHGPAVIGVVLTGVNDDGTVGMATIKKCGGVCIVQDPAEAQFPMMPQAVLDSVAVDHKCPLARLPGLLGDLCRQQVSKDFEAPWEIAREAEIAAEGSMSPDYHKQVGKPSMFICPDCGGMLWQIQNEIERYRCLVGHAFTLNSLREGHEKAVETALWTAVRSLDEKAKILRKIVGANPKSRRHGASARLAEIEENKEVIRGLLLGRKDQNDKE